MNVIALGAGVVAFAAALVRWARVAQREHYLPGGCTSTAARWVRARSINGALLGITLVAVVVVLLPGDDGPEPWLATVASVTVATFPFWMRLRGVGRPLKWTRRLLVLTATSVAAVAVVVAAAWSADLVHASSVPVLAAALLPLGIEVGVRVTAPYERRIARGFQRRAERTLRAVAPQVIAITGSWGKTSTKHHVRDLAQGWVPTAMSPASFNNQAGLSRTMNEHLPAGTELLVVEMGMYGPGEIRAMCDWVRPTVGVITAIGPMHLERVGSLAGIVAAKSEILGGTSSAVLWVESPELAALADTITGQRVWRCGYAGNTRADVTVEEVDGRLRLRVGDEELGITEADPGLHPGNVACAVAALLAAGAPRDAVARQLVALRAPTHRLDIVRSPEGHVVIDDTFNSNPAGARAALAALGDVTPGRRFVVTPGMFELGHEQYEANATFAEEVVRSGASLVATGRSNRRALLDGARRGGSEAVWVPDRTAAQRHLRSQLGEGDGVLWENDLPDHYP